MQSKYPFKSNFVLLVDKATRAMLKYQQIKSYADKKAKGGIYALR